MSQDTNQKNSSEEEMEPEESPSEEEEEELVTTAVVRIPKDRIAVLIGKKGKTKRMIEELTGTKITVDSESGEVTIESTTETSDPLAVWKAKNIVTAIGRGFSPERALALLEDDKVLEIIDLSEFSSGSKSDLRRIKGRIIGEKGKTRRIIEETTGVYVSVYGKTVALIGDYEWLGVARRAIMMLIEGSPHGTVYKYLYRMRSDYKRRLRSWI
ncbi:MAG: KH domain-containing protein [Candidatus Baldrarchaeia archaeon]